MALHKICYTLDTPNNVSGIDRDPYNTEGFFIWNGNLINDSDTMLYDIDHTGQYPVLVAKDQDEVAVIISERSDPSKLSVLKSDLNTYIYSKYSAGTQASFTAYYTKLVKEEGRGEPAANHNDKLLLIESVCHG